MISSLEVYINDSLVIQKTAPKSIDSCGVNNLIADQLKPNWSYDGSLFNKTVKAANVANLPSFSLRSLRHCSLSDFRDYQSLSWHSDLPLLGTDCVDVCIQILLLLCIGDLHSCLTLCYWGVLHLAPESHSMYFVWYGFPGHQHSAARGRGVLANVQPVSLKFLPKLE